MFPQHQQLAIAAGRRVWLRENDRAAGDLRSGDAPRTMALARGFVRDRWYKPELPLRWVTRVEKDSDHR